MLFKLAKGNVKKSFKDYSIYFLTLMLGVCMFYVFNSIESQQSILDLSQSMSELMQTGIKLMGYISVLVAIILGFLILYANKFLMKRRSAELGIYLTLGMDRTRIALMMAMETFLVGLLSLVIGLALGVALSQAFSALSALLLGVTISDFEIVFSADALVKTLICFAVVFLISMAFNTHQISRINLIDLLNSGRRGETLKFHRRWVNLLALVIGCAMIGTAYYLLFDNGLGYLDWEFTLCLILGFFGTFVFFFAIAGIILDVTRSCKGIYYKKLNAFVVRQFSSKMNTNFISISLVCLMLLLSIGTISCGLTVGDVFTKDIDSSAPYDATIMGNVNLDFDREAWEAESFEQTAQENGFDLSAVADDCLEFNTYYDGGLTFEVFDNGELDEMERTMAMSTLPFMRLSDYNHLCRMLGVEEKALSDDQFLIASNYSGFEKMLNGFMSRGGTLEIGGRTYIAAQDHIETTALYTYTMGTCGAVVVPDAAVSTLDFLDRYVNLQFKDGLNSLSLLQQEMEKVDYSRYMLITRQDMVELGYSMKFTAVYLMLYVGIIFMITSAAVLALQQLSEAADNRRRYQTLKRLGVSGRMADRTLFKQVMMYFLLPMIVAICHAAVGLTVINNVIGLIGYSSMGISLAICAALLGAIYLAYFAATYISARAAIRSRR